VRWLIILSTLILSLGCADNEQLARESIQSTLIGRDIVRYKSFESFAGDVICGEYEVISEWGDSRGLTKFIYMKGKLSLSSSKMDQSIFCNPDPAVALYEITGVDATRMGKQTFSNIKRDFAALEKAMPKQAPENADMLADPWGNPYIYIEPWYSGVQADLKLQTLGADGEPGGKDENADIGNWQIKYIDHVREL